MDARYALWVRAREDGKGVDIGREEFLKFAVIKDQAGQRVGGELFEGFAVGAVARAFFGFFEIDAKFFVDLQFFVEELGDLLVGVDVEVGIFGVSLDLGHHLLKAAIHLVVQCAQQGQVEGNTDALHVCKNGDEGVFEFLHQRKERACFELRTEQRDELSDQIDLFAKKANDICGIKVKPCAALSATASDIIGGCLAVRKHLQSERIEILVGAARIDQVGRDQGIKDQTFDLDIVFGQQQNALFEIMTVDREIWIFKQGLEHVQASRPCHRRFGGDFCDGGFCRGGFCGGDFCGGDFCGGDFCGGDFCGGDFCGGLRKLGRLGLLRRVHSKSICKEWEIGKSMILCSGCACGGIG